VTSTQPGVAMVSGFAKNLVKIFLENDGVVNAEAVMKAAIAGEEYQKLAIFD
jgi:sulfur relay (sulfurtransferase) complex TusBCD TusD component (DsrE family)